MSIPIIGQTSTTPLHTDLTPAQQAALAKMAEENPPTADEVDPGIPVTTAFLVAIGTDGAVIATHDLTLDIRPQRGATPDDIYGACAVVQKDITAMETAQKTQGLLMAAGRAMQEQAQEQAIRSRLKMG